MDQAAVSCPPWVFAEDIMFFPFTHSDCPVDGGSEFIYTIAELYPDDIG